MSSTVTTVFYLLSITGVALGQQQPSEVDALLQRLAANPADSEAIHVLAGKTDERVVAAFETVFDRSRNADDKRFLAFILASRGNHDDKYLKYLLELAEAAVDDDAPLYLSYGPDGKALKGVVNPAFADWCNAHGRELAECVRDHVAVETGDVVNLAMVGDQRAADVLVKGLASPNISIAYASACGLGVLHKEDVVPTILARISILPGDAAQALAMSLAEFSSPLADYALRRYVPDPELIKKLRKESAWGKIAEQRAARGVQ